jgi:hypothetical protein
VSGRPLCGKCQNGWLEDADGNLTGRCPCRYREITPAEAQEQGVAATVEANPQAMRAALAIIRDAAKANPVLSSNTVRHEMRLAQVPGPVVGAAFKQAVKDKALRPIGYEPSTDQATHAHPVRNYESRIYRKLGRASA